jgi:tRNA threonylcarbamoyladenosine biosynthesis protein TsaE
MTRLSLRTESERETLALGRRLGELCEAGDVILLSGELGTGKTCLVRGIAHGLGVAETPFSPSFVLVREYRGRLPLYHMDFYRIDSAEEIADLGIDDYLNSGGVCAIEWAERAEGLTPPDGLRATLYYVESKEQARTLALEASGSRHEELLHALAQSTEARRWN